MNKDALNLVPFPQDVRLGKGICKDLVKQARLNAAAEKDTAIRHKLKELHIDALHASMPLWRLEIGNPDVSRLEPPKKPEGYVLEINADGIAIEGYDRDGLFWGLVTLEQLLLNHQPLPCLGVRDWPAYAFRGHHDDISRKQVSKLSDFKRIIRYLSFYKIKYYTPYMEDMLYLKSHPDIGKGRGRLTPQELKAMHREAKRYNVTIFPTYSLIGHQENLLSNPKYRPLAREVFHSPSSLDPDKPAVREFLKAVIADVCELFPDAPFFHAGFDETQGLEEAQLISHANWCAAEISRYGKKMLMWVDMFKNHFGIEKIHKLHEGIIPVEWNYGDPAKYADDYIRAGLKPLGLAGYQNWCHFLPDFSKGKKNLEKWARVMKKWGGEGFACSMWGDNGYENSKDLCWNLFAYNGELSWRGKKCVIDFEPRFQRTFYGAALPAIQKIIEDLPRQRKVDGRQNWKMFRYPIQSMVRMAAKDPKLTAAFEHDDKLFQDALHSIDKARQKARAEAEHIDHFEVALFRELDVCQRMFLAKKIADHWPSTDLKEEIEQAIASLRYVKKRYRDVWLRHSKRENIEVSLAVYDDVIASMEALLRKEAKTKKGFVEIPMADYADFFFQDVAGLPLKRKIIDGVPFVFADLQHTHRRIKPESTASFSFDESAIRDIHLIYGGQTLRHKEHTDSVEVRLLRDEGVVFRERLKNIEDICCWFAPLGEHMWAGGGLQYTDPARNSLAFYAGPFHGLMHLRGFAVNGIEADAIEIESVGADEIAIFAITLEKEKA
ncbi:MAG: glycoside hydrolase family 20 zincin-like fold domain-containing protein [Candidatus Sumerlaeia bacterium]